MKMLLNLATLLTIFGLTVDALEVNLLDSFDLKDGINGVQSTSHCKIDNGFFFAKTPKGITAVNEVLQEVMQLLSTHQSFIVTFQIQAEPFHKGTLLRLEHKKTGDPLFGLWVRMGTTTKVGIQFYSINGIDSVTLEDKVKYDSPRWQQFALHFHHAKRRNIVDLYINCVKVDSKKADMYIHAAPKSHVELRLAQREVAGKIFSRFKGSIGKFHLIFKRNISTYVKASRCESRTFSPPYASYPRRGSYGRNFAAARQPFVSTNQISSLINRFQNAESGLSGTSAIMKEILTIVNDVNTKQDNQIYEMKSLKELLQILGTKHQNLVDSSSSSSTLSKNSTSTSISQLPCLPSPCYPFVSCTVVDDKFKCGACPLGLEGDGITCTDIDECEEKPCSPVSKCENKDPGFLCHACPKGYRGEERVGIGRDFAKAIKQKCTDIDECSEGDNKCDKNAHCKNTMGSYKCGDCKKGYKRGRRGNCLQLQMCDGIGGSKKNPCSVYATCTPTSTGAVCVCRAATAGDGYVCGEDGDGDGYPDKNLKCKSPSPYCKRDNCPFVPNGGQEDTDGDGKGDACDTDIDADGVYNALDNCPNIQNTNQANSDKDSYGDDCDNCMFQYNPDQKDTDGDYFGDVCDKDIDGDKIANIVDNCASHANKDQMDRDRDGKGDVCDNCPDTYNPRQENRDGDGYGDECDNDIDTDKDGFIDNYDNCPYKANADQTDIDGDGKGDLCDDDRDNDGKLDKDDNCKYVFNPLQKDRDGDGVGDKCFKDADGDGIMDSDDSCPNNKLIQTTDFRVHDVILLSKNDAGSHKPPRWSLRDEGTEVVQVVNAAPSILLSQYAYRGFDMSASVFVNTQSDDDFLGFAFGYQNSRNFYLLSWKQKSQTYWRSKPSFLSTAKAGIELKYIRSSTGPGFDLRAALWHSGNYTNQITDLWHDKGRRGWDDRVPYRWELMHRPAMALIRLKVYRFSAVFVDTGYIIHDRLSGGRLGPYAFSQAGIVWSNIDIKCNEALPEDLLQKMGST